MVFMLVLLLINIVAMSVHIILEGLIAGFNVDEIPNHEKSKSVEGVSSCYNDLSINKVSFVGARDSS